MNPKNEMIKIRIKGIALEIKGLAVCLKLKKPVGTGEVRRRRPEGVSALGEAQADERVLPRHVIRAGSTRVYARSTRRAAQ
jgi:hypothetical protein